MTRVAQVVSVERVTDDGGHGVDVICDPGGNQNFTASHFADPGDDSCPLPGDFAAIEPTRAEEAVGYADVRNKGKAAPGEKRIYARDASGLVVGDIWLKGDGTIVATNAGGAVTLSPDGVLSVAGDSDAAALASVVDAILEAIASAVPAAASGSDAGEPGLLSIQTALADHATSASKRLKVGG